MSVNEFGYVCAEVESRHWNPVHGWLDTCRHWLPAEKQMQGQVE